MMRVVRHEGFVAERTGLCLLLCRELVRDLILPFRCFLLCSQSPCGISRLSIIMVACKKSLSSLSVHVVGKVRQFKYY